MIVKFNWPSVMSAAPPVAVDANVIGSKSRPVTKGEGGPNSGTGSVTDDSVTCRNMMPAGGTLKLP